MPFRSYEFQNCCGALNLYCDPSTSAKQLKLDIEKCIEGSKNSRSLALAIITESMLPTQGKVLTDFGFTQFFGPIRNINSAKNLYGFMFDINKYREEKNKQAIEVKKLVPDTTTAPILLAEPRPVEARHTYHYIRYLPADRPTPAKMVR